MVCGSEPAHSQISNPLVGFSRAQFMTFARGFDQCRFLLVFLAAAQWKFSQWSERVKLVDLHPTEAWMLSLYSRSACIRDYHTQERGRHTSKMTKEEEDEEYLEEEEDALAGAGGNTFSFTTFMLLTPLILVRGRLDSDGEVTSEVDQVRALQEEVVIQVQLHQGQEFIDKNAVTISSVSNKGETAARKEPTFSESSPVISELVLVSAHNNEIMREVAKDDFGFKLKEEAMLNKVLKETVLSKVVAIDKLQSGLASSLRIQDVMRNEIQRVQDELSCITHKAKQLELQVSKMDESIDEIQ
ncbi:hypothetical protein ZEAMMB73_Zm00001d020088 [Zea mays]|uniref:Uncharacterized protein n=1 Tax=Zea mays TaxID=4577 RepID=A0A1D6I236_MAIZE|nr:hypothetical protein ZEAMMB73_Zm00001d020088 [Zea mays]